VRKLLGLLLSCGIYFSGAHAEIWHGCALAPNGRQGWVVTIETTEVYHTPDFGSSWQPETILTNHVFFDVYFLDSLNGWTCGDIAEVQHTSDGGKTWAWQGFGVSKFFSRITFIDPTHGWAAGGAAIMGRWDESSQTWQAEFLPNPPFSADSCDFYGISFVDTLEGWMCAGRYPEGDTFLGGQGYIAHTTDGGFTWTLQLRDTVNDLFDIKFVDSLTGWAVGGNDRDMTPFIAKTTDGGFTWQERTIAGGALHAGDALLRAVAFVDDRYGWAVGKFGTILHTSDAGNVWIPQFSGVDSTLFDVDFSDSLTGMASGTNAVVFTSDGGATWRRTNVGLEEQPCPLGPVRPIRLTDLTFDIPLIVRSRLALSGQVPVASDLTVAVYSGQGRLVKTLWAGRRIKGRFDLAWDGVNDAGRKVSSGVYLIAAHAGAQYAEAKILYLRE
jgi:photosystem II stability/assembly factor-like uncharacterized protein